VYLEVLFKDCNLDDLREVIELCNEIFGEETSIEYATQVFNDTKDDSNQIYINGIVDGKIVAHTKLTIIPTMYQPMSTYAIVNHFGVKKEYRRHHIATKMLDEVVRRCNEMSCNSIKLWSRNFRKDAHGLYHNYGFELSDAGFFQKDI